MKAIVLTGPESTGKSWLANHLQQRFGGLLVSEYVREFIDTAQRDTDYADVPLIARCQLQREDAARAQTAPLLILDTNLLSNLLWSQILFGSHPDWLEPQLLARHYDLYLLLSPAGVPWVADAQRCQPDLSERMAFFHECRKWLETHKQPFMIIDGDWAQRHAKAADQVAALLEQ